MTAAAPKSPEDRNAQNRSTFMYVTYIRTSAEKLWDALTQPEFTRAYWFETWHDTTWEAGSPWALKSPDGRVLDSGEVIDIDKPRRLVLRWRNDVVPELQSEGYSQCTFVLEPVGETVKLTIAHEMERPESKFIQAISTGWPGILASLKSLLETGQALEMTSRWPTNR